MEVPQQREHPSIQVREHSRPKTGNRTQPEKPLRDSALPLLLLATVFFLLALFIGQLSSQPLYWALVLIWACALGFAFTKTGLGVDLHSWIWLLPLTLLLTKILFLPQFDLFDVGWSKALVAGFIPLFSSGAILRPETLIGVLVDPGVAGAFFFLLSMLFWFPVTLSLEGALRDRAWRWPVLTCLFVLVWLEPQPSFSAFFLPLLALLVGFFLLMVYRKRADRWRAARFVHEHRDLRRTLMLSFLILLPLLLFLLPWAVGQFSLSGVSIPSLPSIPSAPSLIRPPAVAVPTSTVTGMGAPSPQLAPLMMPQWMDTAAYIGTFVMALLIVFLLAYFLLHFNRGQTLLMLVVITVAIVLVLWLLPPYLGPILNQLLRLVKMAWNGLMQVLGVSLPVEISPTASPLPPGSESSTDPIVDFLGAIVGFFSRASVIAILIGAFVFLIATYFIWRAIRRTRLLRAAKSAREKEDAPTTTPVPSSVSHLYFRWLQFLQHWNLVRQRTETPWEFVQRTEPEAPAIGPEFSHVTEVFVEERYGQRKTATEAVAQLQKEWEAAQVKIPDPNASRE